MNKDFNILVCHETLQSLYPKPQCVQLLNISVRFVIIYLVLGIV